MDARHIGLSVFAIGLALFLSALEIWIVDVPKWAFYPTLALAVGLMVYGVWPWIAEAWSFLKNVKWRSPLFIDKGEIDEGASQGHAFSPIEVSEDDLFSLNIFKKMVRDDIDNLFNVLSVNESIELRSIYSSALPKIVLSFDIWSASIVRVEVGREIRGRIDVTGFPAGDTPKLLVNQEGQYITVTLERGENGTLRLEQIITPEFRERLIRHYLEKPVDIDLSQLFISVEAFDAKNNVVLSGKHLPIHPHHRIKLEKVIDWNWDKYKDE